MKKTVFTLVLIGCFLFSHLTAYGIFQTNQVPEYIKIGLFFESTGRESVNIGGQNLNLIDNATGQNLISNLPNSIEVVPYRGTIYLSEQSYVSFSEAYMETELLNMFSSEKAFVYLKNGRYFIASQNPGINFHLGTSTTENSILLLTHDKSPIAGYFETENLMITSSEEKIKIHTSDYRGGVSFKIGTNNRLTVINVLKLEEYLYGVVPNEMPASWNIEALKAQAISARNFAVKNLNKYSKLGFNLCATTASQVYKGLSSEHRNSNSAVDSTKGQLLYYNNDIAEVYYHSSSGGQTENSENIWSASFPYLKGVQDPYSLGSPHDNWEVEFTKEQIEKLLRDRNIQIGSFVGIEVSQKSQNHRAMKVVIKGSLGNHTLEKESIRSFFSLKSNFFTLNNQTNTSQNINVSQTTNTDYSERALFNDLRSVLSGSSDERVFENIDNFYTDKIIFSGKGWGHGVGLSQYGAKKMGELGFTYQEILQHYFTDVHIK